METVSVGGGEVKPVVLVARPRALIGVETVPAGATVTIDDRVVGAAPTSQAVGPGHHSLVVSAPGFRHSVEELSIREGDALKRLVRLERASAEEWGTPAIDGRRGASGTQWYGWQTLGVDGAGAALLAAGLLTWTTEPTAVGYGALLLGAPIVHASHRNFGRAFGSLGLRVLIPALAGGVGAGVHLLTAKPSILDSKADSAVLDLVTKSGIGMAAGAGVCVVLDASVLSWQSESATSPTRSAASLGLLVGSRMGVQGAF